MGSQFHLTHGYYIDGVDETTAKLPRDWKDRAVTLTVPLLDGRNATAVAPSQVDLIVSKLVRWAEKDRSFIRASHAARPLDPHRVAALLHHLDPPLDEALIARASSFLKTLEQA